MDTFDQLADPLLGGIEEKFLLQVVPVLSEHGYIPGITEPGAEQYGKARPGFKHYLGNIQTRHGLSRQEHIQDRGIHLTRGEDGKRIDGRVHTLVFNLHIIKYNAQILRHTGVVIEN